MRDGDRSRAQSRDNVGPLPWEATRCASRDEQEPLCRGLVEEIPALICRFSPDGVLTFVNDEYCRYFGRRREELEGRDLLRSIPESQRDEVRRRYASLTPEDPIATYEHQVLGPDGTARWQERTDRALFDENGRLEGYQSISKDSTERKRVENEREELLRVQEEFFSMVSHDLRTPLFSIQGFVDLMLQGRVEDPQIRREFLTRVSEQTHRLVGLVNDLLDMSRLEKGRLELAKRDVQVAELIGRVVDQLQGIAQQRGIKLARQIVPPLPLVQADPQRVEQV